MDVGKPRRRVTVEPLKDPVKRPEPAEQPKKQPAEPAKQAR